MLKVHTADGQTVDVDLQDERTYLRWAEQFNDPSFQSRITGMTLVQRGVQYSLPKPQGFRDIALVAEPLNLGKGGERILCFAGDAQITLVAHNTQRAARVAITKPGHRRFAPR